MGFNGSINFTFDGKMVDDNGNEIIIITKNEYDNLCVDAHEYQIMLEDIQKNKQKDEGNKHLKGYIYDSLVYRYKLALEEAVQTRADRYTNFCIKKGFSKPRKEIEAHVREHENKRDEMRFIEILNEAIGEHD